MHRALTQHQQQKQQHERIQNALHQTAPHPAHFNHPHPPHDIAAHVDPALLRRALRLVHCLQKERGASMSYYASHSERNFIENMEKARYDSDRAIQMLHSGIGELRVHSTLMKIRKMVHSEMEHGLKRDNNHQINNHNHSRTKGRSGSHRMLVCFNALISSVVHDYFMEHVARQQRSLQLKQKGGRGSLQNGKSFGKGHGKKGRHHRARSVDDCAMFSSPFLIPSSDPDQPNDLKPWQAPRPANSSSYGTLIPPGPLPQPPSSLMGLEETFEEHQLPPPDPENGIQRVVVADDRSSSSTHSHSSGSNRSKKYQHVKFQQKDPKAEKELLIVRFLNLLACFVKLKESTGVERAVLSNLIVSGKSDSLLFSDLVLEVENQRRLIDELNSLPTGPLRNLVEELVEMSQPLRELQQKILSNFDLEAVFREIELDIGVVWDLITVYIDKLHSLELLIIEEVEYCLPEVSNVHGCMSPVLLENDFLTNLFGSTATEEEVKSKLENMPAQELKDKLLASFFNDGQDVANCKNCGPGSTGEAVTAEVMAELENDPLLLIPNVPASKEWEIDLYELKFLKRIGEGAAGTTYLANWTGLKVAVKVASITETGLEGWRTEVQALQKLHHPNIIRLLGSVYHPNPLTFCLVLEFCNAGDLSQALKLPSAPGFFFQVASGISNGVAYLHSRGVMHRDIKPDNVLIDGNIKNGNFQVKIGDFGVSTSSSSSLGDRTAETGTYRWMSPEVIRHESYSNMADVYSFSIVLWQLVSREDPYMNISQIEAAGKVALEKARPPIPEGTPNVVSSLIERCWSENPDDRLPFDEISTKLSEIQKKLTKDETTWLDAPLGHPVYYPRPPPIVDSPQAPTPAVEEKPKEGKKKDDKFKFKLFGGRRS